jgi:hypothetical protein
MHEFHSRIRRMVASLKRQRLTTGVVEPDDLRGWTPRGRLGRHGAVAAGPGQFLFNFDVQAIASKVSQPARFQPAPSGGAAQPDGGGMVQSRL